MESIWKEKRPERKGKSSSLPKKTEVAVIGGGMAGILCGWQLKEAGVDVVILEARTVGSGQTGNTTAKITSQQGLIYQKLAETFGQETAGRYASASQAAIDEYERIIGKTGISCGFTRLPAYLYTKTNEGAGKLERERTIAVRAGLPASIVYETGLPFSVKAALKLEQQAQFHPLEFLYGLAKELKICEYARVLRVKDHEIYTSRGILRAEKIIFATHFPFPNWPGFYFSRMHQERSYVLAVEAPKLDGMYYGIDADGLSFRDAEGLVLLGGQGHRTGEGCAHHPFENLRAEAKKLWPGCYVRACWAAQDCMTLDSLPYIGRFSRLRPDWYVATGFGKWGMTNSMVAAMAIRDHITGRRNPTWQVFSPQRPMTKTAWNHFLQELGHSAKNFFSWKGPRCPHLGCRLRWNRAEKTWDCPCHGSRFGREGNLIDNPAKRNMGNHDRH